MGRPGQPALATSVIVADDEPHVVEYLQAALQMEGFDVAGTAADADGAVALADRFRPDVALLDLRMPGGGLQAAQLIGSLSPDTRIVMFTADVDSAEVIPLLRAGIDGYVVKGCTPDRLAEALRSAVRGGNDMSPDVNRIAVDELRSRIHAEEQAARRDERARSRIAELLGARSFAVVFQPIIDLTDGSTAGVEALTRFSATPARTPDVWFADADAVGLRTPLELATASMALHELPGLRDALSMAVNLSPETLLSGRSSEILTGVAVDRLVIEVTEHSPVEDYRALIAALAPWREAGARLAVDDAGGGYASFAHILSLEPDIIKLDNSITRHIHIDERRRALARALVGFADELHVSVVAEGIETAAELEVLTELGIQFGQGFHLGRPLPAAEQTQLFGALHDLRDALGHDDAVRSQADRSGRAGVLAQGRDPRRVRRGP